MIRDTYISTETKCHRLGGLNNKHLILSFRGCQVQDQGVSRLGSWKEPTPLQMAAFSLHPHMAEKERGKSFLEPPLLRTLFPW